MYTYGSRELHGRTEGLAIAVQKYLYMYSHIEFYGKSEALGIFLKSISTVFLPEVNFRKMLMELLHCNNLSVLAEFIGLLISIFSCPYMIDTYQLHLLELIIISAPLVQQPKCHAIFYNIDYRHTPESQEH
jgi:hypothetical protein